MNSLERVFAAVTGQSADRPAFILNASLYGARLTGAPLEAHYRDASVYAEGQIAVRETFAPDLLISPFFVGFLGEAFGSELRFNRQAAPNLARPAAASARAACALPMPDVDSHPSLLFARECVRKLAARYANDVPVVGVLLSPMDIPVMIIGIEAWLEALLEDPDGARALLERCTELFVRLGNAMLADGATLLALTANFANPTIVPARVTESIGRPVLEAALGQIKGPIVLHCGGCRLTPHLDLLKGLPNVAAYFIDARDSFHEAREKLGAGPVLLGNLEGPALDRCAPERVGELCARILKDRSGDPHFILGTSQADIPLGTPPECLAAIRDAVIGATVPP